MNQLFNKLYLTLEDKAPGLEANEDGTLCLSVLGHGGRPINPERWSKADVVEGAINMIEDLYRQLAEERLARSLGVQLDDIENLDDVEMELQLVERTKSAVSVS